MSTTTQHAYVNPAWQTPRNTRTLQAFMALQTNEIAERIKTLRKQRGGPPQSAVASSIGVGLRTYQTWEGATARPAYRNLERLADYYGVSEDYILTGGTSKQEDPVVVSEGVDAVRDEFRLHVQAMHDHMDRVQAEIRAVHNRLTRIESRLPLMESAADVLERYAGPERRAHARERSAPGE